MSVYNSENVCDNLSVGYEALFRHDRGTEVVVVNDSLINDEAVATARATAEFIKGGYVEKVVNITSIFIPTLKQNDIFTFKGVNWIAKEIALSFQAPKLIQVTKGVRYE